MKLEAQAKLKGPASSPYGTPSTRVGARKAIEPPRTKSGRGSKK